MMPTDRVTPTCAIATGAVLLCFIPNHFFSEQPRPININVFGLQQMIDQSCVGVDETSCMLSFSFLININGRECSFNREC